MPRAVAAATAVDIPLPVAAEDIPRRATAVEDSRAVDITDDKS